MPPLLHEQRTQEWLDARRGKVTASLAAACLGLDPYTSPKMAWKKISGLVDNELQNRHMQWGVQFEAKARLDYEVESGNFVETTGLWVHPTCEWLAASPDGLIGADGLCEIKCPTDTPPRVPIHHRIQMLIQLACTERAWCDYYAWAGPQKTLLRRVYRAGLPGLICRLKSFYETYVLTATEPPRRKRKS